MTWRGALVALLLGAAQALVLPLPARADSALTIESPHFTYDQDAQLYRYHDARLRLDELSLTASLLEYNATTGELVGTGDVRVQQGSVLAEAQKVRLDVNTRLLVLEQAHLFEAQQGFYLDAETVTFPEYRRFTAENCVLTTCPPRTPAWTVRSSFLDYEQERFAVAYNPTLFLGPAPVFWSPFVSWPTVDERQSGVLRPSFSEQRSSLDRLDVGTRIAVPYFLALDVDHDLTITPEIVSRRGLGTGLEYNYAFWEGQEGSVRYFGIQEEFARKPGNENNILPDGEAAARDPYPTRQLVDVFHNQGFGTGRLVVSGAHSSDGQVRREYDRINHYRPYQTLQTTYSEQGWWGGASLFAEQSAQYTDESLYADDVAYTDLEQRAQVRPALRYVVGGQMPGALSLGWVLDARVLQFTAPEAPSGQMGLVEPTLTLPLPLGEAAELRTRVGRRLAQYDALEGYTPDADGTPVTVDGFAQTVAQMELRTPLSRVFDSGFKHRMTPRLVADWVEDVPQPLEDVVEPIAFAQRLLTLRLDNVLQRLETRGVNTIAQTRATVDLIQRYNLLLESGAPEIIGPQIPDPSETGPDEPLLPFIVDSTVFGSGYRFDINLHYHHQEGRITENAVGLSGSSGPRTTLSVRYNFNEFSYYLPDGRYVGSVNALTLGGRFLLTDTVDFRFNTRANLTNSTPPLDRRLDRVELLAQYSPSCYTVGLQFSEKVDSTIESGETVYYFDRRIDLVFNLGGFFSSSSSAIFGETSL